MRNHSGKHSQCRRWDRAQKRFAKYSGIGKKLAKYSGGIRKKQAAEKRSKTRVSKEVASPRYKGPFPLIFVGKERISIASKFLGHSDHSVVLKYLRETFQTAFPNSPNIYIAVADESQKEIIQSPLNQPLPAKQLLGPGHKHGELKPIIYDKKPEETSDETADKVNALLAAHRTIMHATWVVLDCRYSHITTQALTTLYKWHCENEGSPRCLPVPRKSGCRSPKVPDPMFGVWSPADIKRLIKELKWAETSDAAMDNVLEGQIIKLPKNEEEKLGLGNWTDNWEYIVKSIPK
ncbi:hypothetical protein NHQ30_006114 [Ciborinia camelliae]|nr:hypothetical protein NHQ30_006114 [Ciborinia camelliae]